MSQKSMVDIAYDYAKQFDTPVSFKDIWQRVVEELGYSEEEAIAKVSNFYTYLSLDCRFHNSENNCWILRSKLLYEDATKDIFLVRDEQEEYEELLEEYEDSKDENEYHDEDDDTNNNDVYDDNEEDE